MSSFGIIIFSLLSANNKDRIGPNDDGENTKNTKQTLSGGLGDLTIDKNDDVDSSIINDKVTKICIPNL